MITDAEARRIAADWHGGQSSPLYALASTGTINDDITHEILCDLNERIVTGGTNYPTDSQQTDLDDLLTYCESHGPRSPVPNWNRLT